MLGRQWIIVVTRPALATLLVLFVLGFRSTEALTLYPTRVVLDDSHRAVQLQVINNSDRPQRYLIQWRAMEMDATGNLDFIDVAESPTPQASDHLIVGPRQAIVPPGGYQVVRIMSRLPPDSPAGEYRSHLLISEPAMEESQAPPPDSDAGIAIRIDTTVRTSIPVILRTGSPEGHLAPSAWWIDSNTAGAPILGVQYRLSGSRSINALATLEWHGQSGESRVITRRRFATYTEIEERTVTHVLTGLDADDMEDGAITYTLERLGRRGNPQETLFAREIQPKELPQRTGAGS
ncbi:hypothetical protein V6X63_01490 [Spiribacter sp. 221]|uniref:fimbrial biogenesis chaperone n=1 Tax=Spiribacter onubensis TaxID=3122420 RepID=UPI00349FB496